MLPSAVLHLEKGLASRKRLTVSERCSLLTYLASFCICRMSVLFIKPSYVTEHLRLQQGPLLISIFWGLLV